MEVTCIKDLSYNGKILCKKGSKYPINTKRTCSITVNSGSDNRTTLKVGTEEKDINFNIFENKFNEHFQEDMHGYFNEVLVTCTKNYNRDGILHFKNGCKYPLNQLRDKVYWAVDNKNETISLSVCVGTESKDVNYCFPLSLYKKYFKENLSKDMIKPKSSENRSLMIIGPVNKNSNQNQNHKHKDKKIVPETTIGTDDVIVSKEVIMAIKNKEKFDVKALFLALTSHTYPNGHEHRLRYFLPEGVTRDRHGNYIYQIGESRTIFACHLDTAGGKFQPVTHVFDGDIIKTDGSTILGADDKAGVTVLLYLIHHRIPGKYYFFVGEECGCIGSKAAAKDGNFTEYDRIISFDRRNTCSVITFQQGHRCCSQDFANNLSEQYNALGLNLHPDDTGVVTDSAQFVKLIPECTNISVGYYGEHGSDERQDIAYLENLCRASLAVRWEQLPVVRDINVVESKYKETNNYNNNNHTYNNSHHHNHKHFGKKHRNNQLDMFNHSYNDMMDDRYVNVKDNNYWIDDAMDEDRKRREKKEKKKNKGNKGNQKLEYNFNNDIDYIRDNTLDLIERPGKGRDPFLPYREMLSECANIGEPNLLSAEQYGIVHENLAAFFNLR